MLDLKGKFIVDTGLHKLSNQIYKFAEVIDQISLENRKLTSELDTRLEERIMNLEKIKQKGSSIAKGSYAERYLYPFAHTIDIFGINVRIYKGKGRFTMFFA